MSTRTHALCALFLFLLVALLADGAPDEARASAFFVSVGLFGYLLATRERKEG